MELEVRKIGNAYGVILPSELIERLQIKEGDTLTLLPSRDDSGFELIAEGQELEEQMRAARSLMARYRDTLRDLAE